MTNHDSLLTFHRLAFPHPASFPSREDDRTYEVRKLGKVIGRVIGTPDFSGAKIKGTRLMRGRRQTPEVTWSWQVEGQPLQRRYLAYRQDAAEQLDRDSQLLTTKASRTL